MVCHHHEIWKQSLIYYTSSLGSPFCATYQLSYDGGLTYSLLGCVSTSTILSVLPLPYLPTYTQLLATVSPSLTSSSPSSHTPTPSPAAKMGRDELVGISVGSVLGFMSVLLVLIAWCFYRRRRRKAIATREKPTREIPARHLIGRTLIPELDPPSPVEIDPHSKTHLSFFPPKDDLSIQNWKWGLIRLTSKETAFLTFLFSYGSDGVPLRDLIMLGTMRQLGEKSKNHWSENGELGWLWEVMPEASSKSLHTTSFLNCFMDSVCDGSNIEHFQTRLENLGLIEVRYPKGYPLGPEGTRVVASQYWCTDGRIWILRQAPGHRSRWDYLREPAVVQELFDVFMGIPDKDVSPAAQRQREAYYYHAQCFVRSILPHRERLNDYTVLQAVLVIMQLLTLHYTKRDEILLVFVQECAKRVSHPRMDLLLLWAELKENAFREDYNGLCRIRDRLLMAFSRESSHASPLQNGLLGFILVDLVNTAKTANFTEIVSDVVRAGTKWVDRTSIKKSTLERTALCEALAAFNIHDRNATIPQKYHLFYGYHLSRVGILVQGDRFLASGLEFNDGLELCDRTAWRWPYEFERISIALRLGRHQVVRMLGSLKRDALRNRDEGRDPMLWKGCGECAEVFVLLGLYEADCDAFVGRLDDACAKLEYGIAISSFTHDTYIGTLRVTLKMRLLEVRMWQQNLKEALPIALNLAHEIWDGLISLITPHSTLPPDVIHGMLLQLLNLSNVLLSTEDAENSLILLQQVDRIQALLPDKFSKDLESYVKQRIVFVHRFRQMTESSRPKSTSRTLTSRVEGLTNVEQYPTTSEKEEITAPTNEVPRKLSETNPSKSILTKPKQTQRWAREGRGPRSNNPYPQFSSELLRFVDL